MKTKLFTLFVALLATTNLWAEFQYGNLYYETLSSNTAKVVGYIGNPTSVSIPTLIQSNGKQYTVTSIGNYAFDGCSSLTSVTIPNSVTSIGSAAFRGCSSLPSVTIPNSVTSIGSSAFSGCSSITSIVIPESVTNIDNGVFDGCSSLISVTIPNSVTSIGEYAFDDCSSLTSVTIPNSVTSIKSNPFEGCSGLKSMVVESGNRVYDSRENCNAIIKTATNTLIAGCKNTTIPNSVTSIGNYAFHDCASLTSVTIPNRVTSIGHWTFRGCSSLTSVTIPNSVTSIGSFAFYDCVSLTLVICKAILVPSTDRDIFTNVPFSSAVLYVPDESVDIYKYMNPWSYFGTMLPLSLLPTDVEDVQISSDKDTSVKKVIHNGQVVILHNDKSYNIMGQEVE